MLIDAGGAIWVYFGAGMRKTSTTHSECESTQSRVKESKSTIAKPVKYKSERRRASEWKSRHTNTLRMSSSDSEDVTLRNLDHSAWRSEQRDYCRIYRVSGVRGLETNKHGTGVGVVAGGTRNEWEGGPWATKANSWRRWVS